MKTKNKIRSEPSENATQIYKARQTIKKFWQSINTSNKCPFSQQQIETIQHTILEFQLSGRSGNELAYALKSKGIPFNRTKIDSFLKIFYRLIQEINTQIDRMVSPMINTIEADETFKGNEIKFFECMDHNSGYLMAFLLIDDARFDTLFPHYEALLQRFPKIRYIITDLAPVYPNIISKVNSSYKKQIEHIQCQVHAVRNILKEMQPISQQYRKQRQNLRSLTESIRIKKEKRKKCLKSLRYYEKRLHLLLQQRDTLQKALGVRRCQKNILTKHPQLKTLNSKISYVRSTIKGKDNALESYNNTLNTLEKKLTSVKMKEKKLWYEYITQRKMFKQFIAYCKHSIVSLKEFTDRIKGYRKGSCKSFGTFLSRFATHKCGLFRLHQYLDTHVSVNRLISTNRIESFNNWVKPYKDVRRTWKDTKLTSGYTELMRLKFNLTRRLNNNSRNLSPLEKLGYSLNGVDLYSLIFKRFRLVRYGGAHHNFEIDTSCGRLQIVV